MPFSRTQATQQAREISREELDRYIHDVCFAFRTTFPGIDSVHDVREIIDILAREKKRRDVLDAIAQTEVPFAFL